MVFHYFHHPFWGLKTPYFFFLLPYEYNMNHYIKDVFKQWIPTDADATFNADASRSSTHLGKDCCWNPWFFTNKNTTNPWFFTWNIQNSLVSWWSIVIARNFLRMISNNQDPVMSKNTYQTQPDPSFPSCPSCCETHRGETMAFGDFRPHAHGET